MIVQSLSKAPVYFRYKDLPGSVEPSAIVVVCVLALVVIASVPKLKASATNDKFVLVEVPQVPDSAPVFISLSLKSLLKLAISVLCQPNYRIGSSC